MSKTGLRPRICAVIVTYGQRKEYLEQVVNCLLTGSYPVSEMVIVDNDASPATKRYLDDLSRKRPLIEIVSNGRNLGSAGGFRRGIEAALTRETEYLWLLDDDNLASSSALLNLVTAYQNLEPESSGPVALVSLRIDRANYVLAALGENVELVFGRKNSFAAFHVRDIAYQLRRKGFRSEMLLKRASSNETSRRVQIPYSPYGGLFFHRDVINHIGLPDTRYYLYGDDHDYTYRITRCNGAIYLVSNSIIEELDRPPMSSRDGAMPQGFIIGQLGRSDRQSFISIYYSFRNRIIFELEYLVNNQLVYLGNLVLYSALLTVTAMIGCLRMMSFRSLGNVSSYYRGVFHGIGRKLGPYYPMG